MPKATKPVSVAGIEFDALIGSDYKMEATVPEYATDNGFSVSDAIMLKQETLDMVLYLTDTPVTWYTKHAKKGRVEEVCKKLEEKGFITLAHDASHQGASEWLLRYMEKS